MAAGSAARLVPEGGLKGCRMGSGAGRPVAPGRRARRGGGARRLDLARDLIEAGEGIGEKRILRKLGLRMSGVRRLFDLFAILGGRLLAIGLACRLRGLLRPFVPGGLVAGG